MIECICINSKNKPAQIPPYLWPKEGEKYHIIMIYNMVKQEGILGVVLKGMDLEQLNCGFSCYKMDRFAIKLEDLPALIQMAEDCAELNDFNVEELLTEQLELVEV